jgi:hypothetical protein
MRMALWVFVAVLMGAAGVRVATTSPEMDARLEEPHLIRPASVRGL